jgi:glycosyltransferase involved in cell wall biosynthesis
VVACDTPANRLLLDEETAVLTEPTPEAFADGILRLVREESLRRRLSAAGQARLRERYSYDEFKRRLGRCYAAALAD